MAEKEFKLNVNKHVDVYKQTTFTMFRRGTPDHWYSGMKRDLWVEYKYLRNAPRGGIYWQMLLEPAQWKWCSERAWEGRDVWVIVGFKSNREGMILKIPKLHIEPMDYGRKLLPVKGIATTINDFCGKA